MICVSKRLIKFTGLYCCIIITHSDRSRVNIAIIRVCPCMFVCSITQQEGWLSPTERASVSAISLRHNLATSGESRRYGVALTRFAGGGIWLPQESKAHFGLPRVRVPWDNRGKCYMDGNRIQCWSNASQHIPIYLQPFTSYSEILVGNCDIFIIHLCLAPPQGVTPLEFREDLEYTQN